MIESVGQPSARRSSARDLFDRSAEAGLVLLLLLAPLPLGSVSRIATFVLVLWIAALAWLTLVPRPLSSLPAPARLGSIVFLGALALLALQATPLPRAFAVLLSPRAVQRLDAIPLGGPAQWARISTAPEATEAYLARVAALGALFLVAAVLACRQRGYRRILGAIFAAGIFQAVYGSYEYLSGHQHIFGYVKRFYTDAATGTYINQNHFAGVLEMSFLVGLGWLLSKYRREPAVRPAATWRGRLAVLLEEKQGATLALATATAVVALGLVLSYSRAGLGSAALASAGVLVVDSRRHRDRRWMAPALVLLGSVLVLITLAGWDRVASDLWRQMQGLFWEDGRVRVWRDSLTIVEDFPLLGTGLGTFQSVYPAYRSPRIQALYEYAHNDYLQLLVETGFVGAFAALLLLALFWRAVVRGAKKYYRPDFPLLLGAAGGLVSLMLHEAIDFNLQIPANALIFSAMAGALLGGLHPLDREEGRAGARVIPFLSYLRRKSPAA